MRKFTLEISLFQIRYQSNLSCFPPLTLLAICTPLFPDAFRRLQFPGMQMKNGNTQTVMESQRTKTHSEGGVVFHVLFLANDRLLKISRNKFKLPRHVLFGSYSVWGCFSPQTFLISCQYFKIVMLY